MLEPSYIHDLHRVPSGVGRVGLLALIFQVSINCLFLLLSLHYVCPLLSFSGTPPPLKKVEIISRPETDILHFCPKFHALQSSFVSFKGFDSSCNISLQLRQKETGEFFGETFFILPCFFFAHLLTL